MLTKIVSGSVLTAVLLAFSAPMVAYAADTTPKTKAECHKANEGHEVGRVNQDLRQEVTRSAKLCLM